MATRTTWGDLIRPSQLRHKPCQTAEMVTRPTQSVHPLAHPFPRSAARPLPHPMADGDLAEAVEALLDVLEIAVHGVHLSQDTNHPRITGNSPTYPGETEWQYHCYNLLPLCPRFCADLGRHTSSSVLNEVHSSRTRQGATFRGSRTNCRPVAGSPYWFGSSCDEAAQYTSR